MSKASLVVALHVEIQHLLKYFRTCWKLTKQITFILCTPKYWRTYISIQPNEIHIYIYIYTTSSARNHRDECLQTSADSISAACLYICSNLFAKYIYIEAMTIVLFCQSHCGHRPGCGLWHCIPWSPSYQCHCYECLNDLLFQRTNNRKL
jgi:hypothetical protein